MTSVIHLANGEHPPEKKSCLQVLSDTVGGCFVLSSADGYRRGEAPSSYPIVDGERSAAIERAKTFAETHAIDTVYVDAG